MIIQNFDLNLIPDSAPVVVHVDQYDHGTGRLRISLYEGDVSYEPSGTAQIQGSKPDGKGFLYNASLSGNVVTANLEEQMTAVAGKVLAQVIVTETSGRTGSFKFVLDVQKSALPDDTDMSESDYQAIEELIEEAQEVAEEVAEDRTAAENAATSAEDSAEDSEAWAKGTRNGTAVPPTDPTYQQNSKYWAGQAEQYAQGGLKFVGTIYFASLPTSGMRAGDMYNIKDAFTTDSRFEEGAGIRYPEGTNVAWTPNGKWDVLAGNIRVLVSITLAQFNALTPAQKNDPTIWWWVPDANNGTMGGSVSSVTAYPELTDKPSINGVEINGAMTSSMLHLAGELPEIMPISKGGTGNNAGYIRTGLRSNTTIGTRATAEGDNVTASGDYSHGEGSATKATGKCSHSEGDGTTASGYASHSEGNHTTASGAFSHAEGDYTTASGQSSHAGGNETIAAHNYQTAIGRYNDNKSDTLFEVGNGSTGSNRSNAFEVYSNGNVNVAGAINVKGEPLFRNKYYRVIATAGSSYIECYAYSAQFAMFKTETSLWDNVFSVYKPIFPICASAYNESYSEIGQILAVPRYMVKDSTDGKIVCYVQLINPTSTAHNIKRVDFYVMGIPCDTSTQLLNAENIP